MLSVLTLKEKKVIMNVYGIGLFHVRPDTKTNIGGFFDEKDDD